MRFEFNQGVPKGCVEWLWNNVGNGNRDKLNKEAIIYGIDNSEYGWFYERIEQEIKSSDPNSDSNIKYVPTITIKDEKKAILFALRWL